MRPARVGIAAFLIALITLVAAPLAAANDSAPVTQWTIDVNLTDEGVAQVQAEMTMDFSQVAGRGPEFVFPMRQSTGNSGEYVTFDISNLSVSSPTGARTTLQTGTDSGNLVVRVGDANVVNRIPGWIDAVASDDIQRVARTYLTRGNRTVIDRKPEAMLQAATAAGTPADADQD